MTLLVEWEGGKKDKIVIAAERKEEITTALKNPWVNVTLCNEETGEFWYLFHAKKITWQT